MSLPRVPRFAVLLAGIVALHPAAPLVAQEASQGGDPAVVLEVVLTMFDGMREADSTKVRSAFAEGARFASAAQRQGVLVSEYASVDGWIASIAASAGRWEERLFDVEVRVDDVVATVWAPYSFYLDGQLRHCGVNSIQLLRTSGGWKVTQLSDSRRTEGCRQLPPGGAAR